jgi:hypothetical protein
MANRFLPGHPQPSLQDEVRAHRCLRGLALSKHILVNHELRGQV